MIVADSGVDLAAPLLFLFNGGEETVLTAAHGFMAASKWARSVGAFVNLESTGPAGPDVLFQHTGALASLVLMVRLHARTYMCRHAHALTAAALMLQLPSILNSQLKDTAMQPSGCMHANMNLHVMEELRVTDVGCNAAGSWTLEAYARGAKHPHGSVFAQVGLRNMPHLQACQLSLKEACSEAWVLQRAA